MMDLGTFKVQDASGGRGPAGWGYHVMTQVTGSLKLISQMAKWTTRFDCVYKEDDFYKMKPMQIVFRYVYGEKKERKKKKQ